MNRRVHDVLVASDRSTYLSSGFYFFSSGITRVESGTKAETRYELGIIPNRNVSRFGKFFQSGNKVGKNNLFLLYDASETMPAQHVMLLALDSRFAKKWENLICKNELGMEPFKFAKDENGHLVVGGVRK